MAKSDLTDRKVASLLKQPPGRHRVGPSGLYLQVRRAAGFDENGAATKGAASWLFRFMLGGKAHWAGLGSYYVFSLAEARQRARKYRQQLADKIDPLEVKHKQAAAEKIAAARDVTFAACAKAYIDAHRAGWKNPKHARQWSSTFGFAAEMTARRRRKSVARSVVATTLINDRPVGDIDTDLVLKCLEPIWQKTPETAARVRQRIESVLDWAKARGYRQGENPARWRGHLDNLLPKASKVKRVRHHPALRWADMPQFMALLRNNHFISARALEFAILTAARSAEVINATWEEIDLMEKTWIVPAERVKAGREHRVPLSDRAVKILAELPREDGNPHVFIGVRGALGNNALLQVLKAMRAACTVHGFRSTFRDWAAERTNFANHVVEMALAHAVHDKVEAAYRRGDLFDKRRELMAEWATFCASYQTAQADAA